MAAAPASAAPASAGPAAPARLAPGPAFASWLAALDTFLFDVDGVLWRGGVGVPGVGATVAALEAAGKRCFFVTNNSTKTRDEYVALLASVAGVRTTRAAVLSSAYAAAVWCRDAGLKKKVYCIGGAGLAAELAEVAGVTCIGAEDAGRAFAFGAARPADLDPDVEAVVIGFDPW